MIKYEKRNALVGMFTINRVLTNFRVGDETLGQSRRTSRKDLVSEPAPSRITARTNHWKAYRNPKNREKPTMTPTIRPTADQRT